MMHKLSILGYGIGLIVAIASIIRWLFIWDDPSQAVLGASIGLLIIVLSYVYNFMRNADVNIERLDKRLDAFAAWEFKQTDAHIENEIRGGM